MPGREQAVRAARARVGVPDLTRREVWGRRDPEAVRAILAEAEADRGRPWPRTLLSDYARYWRDGVRTAYEDPAGEVRRRTSAAVLAAALTADQAYVDEAADGLMQLCEQTTWCWAAHESFATARGEVTGDPDQPYLDLGAAETADILAWADLVLGPALDDRVPGLRRRMRREVRQRVIQPFRTDRRWHWLGLDGHLHNWNPWIHGHVLAAALFLEDDPQIQAEVTDLVVDGLSRYLDAMPADGGCDEGYAYWWNGPARLAQALDVLDRVTEGAFDPWSCTPFAELARYPQRVALGNGWYVNVADGSARPDPNQPWHVLHRWGRRHDAPDVMAQAAAHRDRPIAPAAGLGRAVLGLTDDAWWDAGKAELPLPRSTWLPDVQLFVARDDTGLTLAVKGGHNDENHNHNDVGSFIAALDSTPVLIDLGQPTYTALSFSDRRYEQWVVQSGWHNVPVIDGQEQQQGSQYKAADLVVQKKSLSMQIAGAYPEATSYRRVATLDGEITIADEWEGSATQHFVIAGTPIGHEAGRLLVETLAEGYAELTWDAGLGTGRLERRAVDDALLEGVWGPTVHRLAIDCTGDSFRLTVRRGERP
ncbi:heparinase II/III family protein [Kribbella swartbergensis]